MNGKMPGAQAPDRTGTGQAAEKLLEVRDISVRYGSYCALENVSFDLKEGEWLMLIGPNGAGKSTAAGAISRGVAFTGEILYRGQDIRKMKARELARKIGVLLQNHYVGYSFTVEEVVRLGRYAYTKGLFEDSRGNTEDRIDQALELTGLLPLRGKSVLELSGGELQRVFLAQLFAQDPEILILDEPTNHLDLVYQKQVFSLIGSWLAEGGRAVISVVHDLSLAKAYGTKALLLDRGRMAAGGTVDEVFSPEKLNSAYGLDVREWMRGLLSQWEG